MRTLQARECSKCGESKRLNQFYYHRTRKHYMSTCKECNSKICAEYQRGKRKAKNTGFIFTARAGEIRRTARIKGVPVTNDLSRCLKELWESQGGKCFYTGLEMSLSGYQAGNDQAVTVDRIVPSLGYVEGNIAMCCSIVNRMKQNMSCDELFDLCELLLNNKPRIQAALELHAKKEG